MPKQKNLTLQKSILEFMGFKNLVQVSKDNLPKKGKWRTLYIVDDKDYLYWNAWSRQFKVYNHDKVVKNSFKFRRLKGFLKHPIIFLRLQWKIMFDKSN